MRQAVEPYVLSLLLLIVIAGFLRVAVTQSGRRSLAPAVIVVIIGIVLLGAFMMRHPPGAGQPPAAQGSN